MFTVVRANPHSSVPSPPPWERVSPDLNTDGAGKRGQHGCHFYPGRRANALALGYNLSPFQG